MPLLRASYNEVVDEPTIFEALEQRKASALILFGVPYFCTTDVNGKKSVNFDWVTHAGYTPDRSSELGGTAHFPDMPPHIDPHPKDSLKVHLTTKGIAVARFTLGVSQDMLDEVNELPGSDYRPLQSVGLETDEVELQTGDIVCFFGSTTLHEFVSKGIRESIVNSYTKETA